MAQSKALQAIVEIAGSISPTLGKSIEEATGKLGGLNLKALAVGAAVGGIAVATGKAVFEAGQYLVELGSQFDEAADSIRIGTGATGDALDALMDDFDAVYSSVPTTMEDASQAIADYNTRLGLTGPALQEISTQAIQVADMLGDDLGTVIEESSQAFQAWNIDADAMGDAMDYVFKAAQSTGVGFSDLMSSVQQFAPQLQELGYSFEESVALIGQMDKAGVNASEVLSAMKKSVSSLAKEGLSASEGMELYAEKIKNAKDMTEATTIASEIFGTKAASTMAAAIRDGTVDVAELTEELEKNSETIGGCAADTYDFAEQLKIMKQGLDVALKPIANTVFDSLNKFMPVLQKLMEKIVPVINDAVEAAAPFVEDFLIGTAEAIENVLPLISQLAADLLPILTQLISSLLPPLLSLVQTLLPPLMEIVGAILPPISSLLSMILPMITQLMSSLLPPLLSLVQTLLPPLMEIVGAILPPISSLLSTILPMITQIVNAVLPVLVQIISALLPVITPLLDVALQIVNDVIMPLMEPIMQLVNTLLPVIAPILNAINAVLEPLAPILQVIGDVLGVIIGAIAKVVGWIADGLGWLVDLIFGGDADTSAANSVNGYATGGFTSGPSIAGEDPRYPTEAIISFDPAYREANIGYWLQAGEMLGIGTSEDTETSAAGRLLTLDDFSLSEMAGGQTIIYYDFSGFTWSPTFGDLGSNDDEDLMDKLRDHEAEFFDWLEEWLRVREEGRYCNV